MDVEEIIARTVEVYATCDSYQDEGEAASTIVNDKQPEDRDASVCRFATAFSRPDSFMFDYWVHFAGQRLVAFHHVVWSEDGVYRKWSGPPTPREDNFRSMHMAVIGPTGESLGSARRIPSLLAPASPLHTEYSLLDSGHVDGVRCFVLRRDEGDESETLWIEESSGLVRQVEERTMIKRPELPTWYEVRHPWTSLRQTIVSRFPLSDPVPCETKTTYRPQLNCSIPSERFDYDPSADPGYRES